MKPSTKITIINDQNEKFFGDGPCTLLHLIQEYGSLRAASIAMNMSYSKAFNMIKKAEQELGFSLTYKKIGGKQGGGSELTDEAKEWLARFETYKTECKKVNEELFSKYFPSNPIGAIVMASGLGKRFGGNKLMADFHGEPLIASILGKIQSSFPYTLVITRNTEVNDYANRKGFRVLLHDLPGRNDAIRIGIKTLPKYLQGCIFFQADQPYISKLTIRKLIEAASKYCDSIIRVSCNGIPSSPVYFPKWLFQELCSLPEGKGGSILCERYANKVIEISVHDANELKDIDTKEDLINANSQSVFPQ